MRITIEVEKPLGQAIGIKEDLAMYLERWGDARVISVTDEVAEQMELKAADAGRSGEGLVMAETICLLGKNRSTVSTLPECKPGCTRCAKCGWNPAENECQRRLVRHEESWMTGPDKLRRLMVGRNDDES